MAGELSRTSSYGSSFLYIVIKVIFNSAKERKNNENKSDRIQIIHDSRLPGMRFTEGHRGACPGFRFLLFHID